MGYAHAHTHTYRHTHTEFSLLVSDSTHKLVSLRQLFQSWAAPTRVLLLPAGPDLLSQL